METIKKLTMKFYKGIEAKILNKKGKAIKGHTTETCPAPHTVIQSAVGYAFERQIRPWTPRIKPPYVIPDQVSWGENPNNMSHATCLEFHPTKNNILLSGNWEGQLVAWDFHHVAETVVYTRATDSQFRLKSLNTIKFNPKNDGIVYVAFSDGIVICTDLETRHPSSLRLYRSFSQLFTADSSARELYGMDINADKHALIVADDHGYLNMIDIRANSPTMDAVLIHKKGSKVVGLHCNPVQPDLLLSCATDRFARIWDIRRIEPMSSMFNLEHRQTISSAFFSPVSGNKILTTSKDNRLCVWDPFSGNRNSPSREIVHGHELQYLTSPQAEWDPKDPFESLAVIGRSISGNCRSDSLVTSDFIDTSTGKLVAEFQHPNITVSSWVIKLHPRDNVLASVGLRLDLRSNDVRTKPVLIHERGTRVVGLHCNPAHPNLLWSCGNDHFARIWDIRRMKDVSSVFDLPHNNLINSAFFSPVSGSKVLTTSLENRLSIWDSIFGNMDTPSREIVHSHGISNMYPHRAEWDPKVHPMFPTIDYIDVGAGKLVAEIINPKITSVSPINKLHPRDDVLATSSTRSVTIWRPEKKIFVCDRDENQSRKRKVRGESDDSDDDKSNPNSPK